MQLVPYLRVGKELSTTTSSSKFMQSIHSFLPAKTHLKESGV